MRRSGVTMVNKKRSWAVRSVIDHKTPQQWSDRRGHGDYGRFIVKHGKKIRASSATGITGVSQAR